MEQIISGLLRTDFTKFCLIVGAVIFLIGASRGGQLFRIKISLMDTIGRWACLIVGAILLFVPVISVFTGASIGLYGGNNPSSTGSNQLDSGIFFSSAYAQNNSGYIRVNQRQAVEFSIPNMEELATAVYVGDVHLNSPNTVLIFKNSEKYSDLFRKGVRIGEKQLLGRLDNSDIIANFQMVIKSSEIFTYKGVDIGIQLTDLRWNIIGADSVELKISAK